MSVNYKGTVLILSTYPIVEPKHGGQLRVQNIKRAYERAGWKVINTAVYTEEAYSSNEVGSTDVAFPADSAYRLFNGRFVYFVNDLTAGRFAAAEDGGLPLILSKLPSKVDVIQVEQSWLWPLALKLRSHPIGQGALLVNSSHNIETPLKKGIFEGAGIDNARDALDAIEELEMRAARDADITLSVTREEGETLSKWGARNVLLLPNGIEPWSADQELLDKWRRKLPRYNWLLYVASAHPPNFSHFAEIFGGSLGCFPPTTKLVVVGGVCEHIYAALSATKWSSLNHSRLELLFSLPEQDLSAVKTLAHGFVLPIPFGGGSNIKTAEALYSGAYVVGTPSAFRGYEEFTSLPEVRIGRNPSEFQKGIREVLSLPRPSLSASQSDYAALRSGLCWDKCLEKLPIEVEKMLSKKGAS